MNVKKRTKPEPYHNSGLILDIRRQRYKNVDILVWPGQTIQNREVVIMLITNISEAKAQLSALIEKVKAGEDVIIGKAGKPVARLTKYEVKETQRKPGILKGKIKIAEDFDELPPDIKKAFGMED